MMKELNFEQKQANQTFDLGDNTILVRVAKANYDQELKLSEMAQSSVLELLRYGAQRWLNDKTGGSDKTPEEVNEIISNNMQALLSEEGWVATTRSAGVTLNPLEKIVQDLATDKVKAALRAKGYTIKQIGRKKLAELVANYIESNELALKDIARTQLEAAKALDDITLDL